jgi:copper chaperone CopZ
LKIGGMTCMGCVNSIQNSLLKQDGIKKAVVTLEDEKGVIEYDSGLWDGNKIADFIENIGFDAKVID